MDSVTIRQIVLLLLFVAVPKRDLAVCLTLTYERIGKLLILRPFCRSHINSRTQRTCEPV
jgi:hypothetical protein